ncbi:MAG TPA: DsbA family oxidoreductase [Pararobbsia sp.]|jgi:predicted DsbA family dithiol-disulfide isomerase|nr:DsbA family oxidoreductase [Pararobbsia sp.]
MSAVEIQVTSDFICPWCWVGHQNLLHALNRALMRTAGRTRVTLDYRPFELNPDMPEDGIDRKTYRTAKFGSWERSQARDAEVTAAGARAGLDFQFSRIAVTPNTRLAHRLIEFARTLGDSAQLERLYGAVFEAYFSHGLHIGRADVLVKLADHVGLDADATRNWLDSDGGEAEVSANETRAELEGIRAVPTIRIGRTYIQGAQPVTVYANALDGELTLSVAHKY